MAHTLTTTLRDGVFTVTLNRPDAHNALDEAMIEDLRQAVEIAAAERDAAVVLLCGEGPSFCAGADVAWMKEMGDAGESENQASARRLARLFLTLDCLEKPLVGRIHGAAFGGGVGLAAICDIAVASRSCRFALSEVRLGVIPGVIAPYVIRKVGPGRARELMLTGRRFDGEEAAALGLVARAVDELLLDSVVCKVIADLKAGGPQAIAQTKRLLRELCAVPRPPLEVADWTARMTAAARATEEARAGLAAFLDKTSPPWAGGPPAR